MNEKDFFSRSYVVRCPVWLVIDPKRYDDSSPTGIKMFLGKPCLGPFLPLFLSLEAADAVIREMGLIKVAALEIKTQTELHRKLKFAEVENVVIYFGPEKVRFYRSEDLIEEVKSHDRN